ncbi:MAG TPA: T9SS type A sorting domain-containing protein [bacterium]|nr:T9SS type A sorting domain-containing protein [bacterium]
MKRFGRIRIIGLLLVFGMATIPASAQVFTGDTILYTQLELATFGAAYTEVDGQLCLAGPEINDLTPLANLTRVNHLVIQSTALVNLHGLEQLVTVKMLQIIANSSLVSLQGLDNLHSCSYLCTFECEALQTIAEFNDLDGLTVLIEKCDALTSITGFNSLVSANSFYLVNNLVLSDISGFAQLRNVLAYGEVRDNPALVDGCVLYYVVKNGPFPYISNSNFSKEEILSNGPCGATQLAVPLQCKDSAGNAVGDVICRLVISGESDWKQQSGWEWQTGPYTEHNVLYKGKVPCFAGDFQFKFEAPQGWRFVGPDFLTIPRDGCNDFYASSPYALILERADGSTAPPAPPELVCPVENTAPFALAFLKGTPCWKSESWCNAVDGDIFGWDGTATVLPDETGFAWAIFRFADDQTHLVHKVGMGLFNFEEMDQEIFERFVQEFEVLVSTTGMDFANFTSIGKFKLDWPFMQWFNVTTPMDAKFVMLKILQPYYSPHDFKQVVEFTINNDTGFDIFANPNQENQTSAIMALPEETALIGSYPNPFNPATTISYKLAESGPVHLTICNTTGQIIATLVDGMQTAGQYTMRWNAANEPSGVYLCRLQAGSYQKTLRILLVK